MMPDKRAIHSAVVAMALLSSGAVALGALAQGSDTSSGLSQYRRGETDGGRRSGKNGPVAQVGAGTTDASTTGYSGPEEPSARPPGEIAQPPLPNPSVCDAYRDTPFHRSCLQVVLRQDGR